MAILQSRRKKAAVRPLPRKCSSGSTLIALAAAWTILASTTTTFTSAQNDNDIRYQGCNLQDYYAGLLLDTSDGTTIGLREDVTRPELEALLESTHRHVLPYTHNDRDDVWKALIDLDAGSDETVRLLYRQVDVPARPYGTPATWNREHVWPKSRGVEYAGADFTDIHHLRPCDWNVNSARSNLYFGACGIGEPWAACRTPAHPEAAADTAADSVTFSPPTTVRGDVARAILYMDLRYSHQNNNGLDLVVTDCPSDQPHEMAYKSQLLEWHAADAVTDDERYRNQRACERWQGNRNVFVDFPELVERFFGLPQTPLGEGLGYPGCEDVIHTNPPPTSPSTPSSPSPAVSPPSSSSTTGGDGASQCSDLAPADVMMVSMNSDTPELVAFVTFQDLKEGLVLFMTDNAWTGSSVRTNEGTLSFRVPSGGMAAGTVFGYGGDVSSTTTTTTDDVPLLLYSGEWESEGGQFQLSASGDTILLYCRQESATTSTTSDNNTNSIRFLSAVDYSGDGWMESNLEESVYGTGSSALPSELASAQLGALSLPHFDNYYYNGSTEGTILELQTSLSDPGEWRGSSAASDILLSLRPTFTVTSSPSSPGTSPSASPPSPSPGDVMVVGMNSANPDLIALVALESLPGNFELYLTDNAWTGTGTGFRSNEGTLKLTVPSTGIAAGTVFGYGEGITHGDDWESVGGSFALSESGDTILLYTKTDDSKDEIIHLGAFSYAGVDSWKNADMSEDAYETDSSALPDSLSSVGATSLPHQDNYAYVGPTNGDKAFLQSSLQNVSNWQGSSDPTAAPPVPFSVRLTNPSSSSASSLMLSSTAVITIAVGASLALSYVVSF